MQTILYALYNIPKIFKIVIIHTAVVYCAVVIGIYPYLNCKLI